MLGHYQILTGSGHGCKAWIGRSCNTICCWISYHCICESLVCLCPKLCLIEPDPIKVWLLWGSPWVNSVLLKKLSSHEDVIWFIGLRKEMIAGIFCPRDCLPFTPFTSLTLLTLFILPSIILVICCDSIGYVMVPSKLSSWNRRT